MKGNALGRTLLARAGTPPLAGFCCGPTVALPRFAAGRREDRSFILGPLGAWPHFFQQPDAARSLADLRAAFCACRKIRESKHHRPFECSAACRWKLQDIVMGKTLPIAAGTHPLSAGKSGT
jgi:hypothetical protein